MPRRIVTNTLRGFYDSVFSPGRLVSTRQTQRTGSVRHQLGQLWSLTVVYALNLVTYAGPLTAAGFGVESAPPMPAWFASGAGALGAPVVWTYAYAFTLNSLYLLAGTVLTLVTFHVVVVLARQSRGFLRTAYAVSYSTSAYLGMIFTVAWLLSTYPGVDAAERLVVDAQKAFIYRVIDALGASVELPSGRPGPVDFGTLSGDGQVLLAALLVLVGYYLYSLYLASRLNHETDRITGLLVVGAVAISPVVYVAGSVLAYTTGLL
ncbi:MAG: hypothetical protein ABEJ70_04575 [Halobacteriaceae archaeon]